MKTLIFSDTHLTEVFEPDKYLFLKKIIAPADQVIINGDFWDGYLTSFSDFIDSRWNELFALLKEKKTIYLFGNHDRSEYNDQRMNLFSVKQGNNYQFKLKNKEIIIEHGHRLFHSLDLLLKYNISTPTVRSITRKKDRFEKYLIKKTGIVLHTYLGYFPNRQIKKKIKKELSPNQIFVCGHTHLPAYDLKKNYLNTGFIQHGIGHYIIVDGNNLSLFHHR